MVTGLNHAIVVWFVPNCYPDSASLTHLQGFDGLRMHPYGHPLHPKLLNYLIYIIWRCNQVWICSWPQPCHSGSMVCTQLLPRLSKINPPTWLWWTRDTSIQLFTASEGSYTYYKHIRWKCNPIWSGSWPQLCHSGMVCTQLLLWFSQLNPPQWLWWTNDASIWPFTASEVAWILYIYKIEVQFRLKWFLAATM